MGIKLIVASYFLTRHLGEKFGVPLKVVGGQTVFIIIKFP